MPWELEAVGARGADPYIKLCSCVECRVKMAPDVCKQITSPSVVGMAARFPPDVETVGKPKMASDAAKMIRVAPFFSHGTCRCHDHRK